MDFPFTSQAALKISGRIAENGLRTEDVCKAAGVGKYSFSNYRNGKTRMSVDAENALTLAIDELSSVENEGNAK